MGASAKLLLAAFVPLAFVGNATAADYGIISGDAANPASWTPNAGSIISGSTITPLVGDRLVHTFTNNADQIGNNNATIVINAGAEFVTQGTVAAGQDGNNRAVRPHLVLAGTGTDGQGAFKNTGGGWVQVSDVSLSANATVRNTGGGWRHDNHGTGFNALTLNGNTLTVTGNQGMWLVNTVVTGPGVIDVQSTGLADSINFEGSSVLPADVTLKIGNGTLHSSWDGTGRVMAGNVEAAGGSVIEARYNDLHKTYTGQITLTGGATSLRTGDSGGGGGSLDINGKVTGPGELVKDGGASVDLGTSRGVVFLNNGTNDYTGGTRVESGVLRKGADGAIPAGKLTVNGGTLDLNGFPHSMTEGLIKASITGGGSVLSMDGPGVKEIQAGAAVSIPVELSGGILKPNHDGGNNILGNGLTSTVLVTGDATLKPFQSAPTAAQAGLAEWNRVGPDVYTDVGTDGATFRGIRQGIDAIDSTAKPYGDNNKFIYTGAIVNSTGSPMTVSFAEQYDDQIRVKVNGNTVVLDNGWNTATQSAAVTLNPGVNTVEFSSFDGAGGAGPNSGWTKGIGIAAGDVDSTDNALYGIIRNGSLPAGLSLEVPAIDNSTDRTENKNIEIDGGVALTVDTGDMRGRKYSLTGALTGGGGLTKAGSGVAALAGANSHTGPTRVNEGTLKLENVDAVEASASINVAAGATLDTTSLANWTVNPGQSLTGVGTVDALLVTNAGTIAPGNSIGTLTINGNLTATSGSNFAMELGSPGANDELIVQGTNGMFTIDGTLTVTSLVGAGTYMPGDSWDLFDATTFTGSFDTVNLPALSSGYIWDTSALNTAGSIMVAVPEASSSILALLAGMGFTLRRRRR